MGVLDGLQPEGVFHYFQEICAIPHGSGNTKALSDYCAAFARARQLRCLQDAHNNLLIFQPGTPGYENADPVILQGHLDMVCEKTTDSPVDFLTDGLQLQLQGDYVSARGTTLGGDDGIAVAMMLALLDDSSLPHPPLEAVFTVDEEVGMLGAEAMDMSPLQGRRMLNLDSEEEGVFTVGCAGGAALHCQLPVRREAGDWQLFRLDLSGLTGGHSGEEINRGRGNAVQLMGRLLDGLSRKLELRLESLEGGRQDNAIPRSCQAQVALAPQDAAVLQALTAEYEDLFRHELRSTEPGLSLRCREAGTCNRALTAEDSLRLVRFLLLAPGGVQEMNREIPDLVQTSLNLGILQLTDSRLEAVFCIRSMLHSQKQLLCRKLQQLTELLGGTSSCSGDYPGWEFRQDSQLLRCMTEVFREQYGREPVVKAIHAGLECGIFAHRLPGLDCVSIGPALLDIHTVRERMSVSSVQRVWALLTEVLRRCR